MSKQETQVKSLLGHDKKILLLATAHASIFNTPRQTCFWLNLSVNFFYVIRKFLPADIFGNFLFDSPSFYQF